MVEEGGDAEVPGETSLEGVAPETAAQDPDIINSSIAAAVVMMIKRLQSKGTSDTTTSEDVRERHRADLNRWGQRC